MYADVIELTEDYQGLGKHFLITPEGELFRRLRSLADTVDRDILFDPVTGVRWVEIKGYEIPDANEFIRRYTSYDMPGDRRTP